MAISRQGQVQAKLSTAVEVAAFRERYREEMNCQIVHDSIHRRAGWTLTYLLEVGGLPAGFASVAIAGPWKDKPTLFEFYVVPGQRSRVFDLFEALLAAGQPQFMEVQTNDILLDVMLHTHARDIRSEKIVFQDKFVTELQAPGATMRRVTPEEEIRAHMEQRQDGGEWLLEINGEVAGKGGILFHYNLPYGDLYMEIAEKFRRRGLGSYLVQELKRAAYGLGAVPGARCNNDNVASRRTLQRAGFVPFAHIVTGVVA